MQYKQKGIEPSIKVFLTADEMTRFEAFLEVRGAKKGPFTRQLILRELAAAERTTDRAGVAP